MKYYYGAVLAMWKSSTGMLINPPVVFTLMRQRWSSTTFSLLLASLVWTSNTYFTLGSPYDVRNCTPRCKSTCNVEKSWACCVEERAFREKHVLFLPGTKHTKYLGFFPWQKLEVRIFRAKTSRTTVCMLHPYISQPSGVIYFQKSSQTGTVPT